MKCELVINTTFGLESVLKDELKALKFEILKVEDGSISVQAELKDIAILNIWLRTAEKVFLKLDSFKCLDFDDLFDNLNAFKWKDILPKSAKIITRIKLKKSKINSERAGQSVAKKAILSSLAKDYHISSFSEAGNSYEVFINIVNNQAEVLLNTSGEALHRRGYRLFGAEAPIKETLAAGLVLLSRWKKDTIFVDPFCGSGTILFEAAMIKENKAPGMRRKFAFNNWNFLNHDYYENALKFAREKNLETIEKMDSNSIFKGYDISADTLYLAQKNFRNAKLSSKIIFTCQDVRDFYEEDEMGYIITNPPYGERLSEQEEIQGMITDFGKIIQNYPKWKIHLITAYENFEADFGRKADKNRKLYNGNIKSYLYSYFKKRSLEN